MKRMKLRRLLSVFLSFVLIMSFTGASAVFAETSPNTSGGIESYTVTYGEGSSGVLTYDSTAKWKEKGSNVNGLKAKFSDVKIGDTTISAKAAKIKKNYVTINGDNVVFSGPYEGTVPKSVFGK